MPIPNRTLFIADNLDIMRRMNSETIDLIYLDPPFNTKKQYKAPIGSLAEGAEFKDIWTDEDVKDGWYSEIAEDYPHIHQIIQAAEHTYDHSMMIYLMAMGIRLIEMQRLLRPTGSIYLHCDPTASHYLKLVMDDIFGKEFFANELIWAYSDRGKPPKGAYPRKHDIMLFYTKHKNNIYNRQYIPLCIHEIEKKYPLEDDNGRYYWHSKKANRKSYFNGQGTNVLSYWIDIPIINQISHERTGYPTQKPLALLERIIKASSNENDVVLDPFCGCATACVAAEKLQRQWIGIDISPAAETITKLRLEEASEQGQLFSPIQMSDVTVTREPPIRTDPQAPTQIRLPNYTIHKNALYGEQAGNCNGCTRHFEIQNLTVDHILPVSQDGTDHPKNLQLLCQHCNSTKSTGTQEDLLQRLREQGIIN